MFRMTANFKVSYRRETVPVLRVTEPVRQMDAKEQRRQRVAKLSRVLNALHGETLARLAK